MKRMAIAAIILLIAGTVFAADWANGIYFAQEEEFAGNGWKYNVTLEVRNGKIVDVVWNGTNINGGPDKVTLSEAGKYPMVERGGAQAPWHEQAAKAEAYLLKTQDPTAITFTDDAYHTDAIAGVSVHVDVFPLADMALKAGPVSRGLFEDGYYWAAEDAFAKSGWKYFAHFTVVNGTIVQVNWNGVHKDGGDSKKVVSMAGNYPMVANGGAQSDWHVQAAKAEAYLLKIQDPAKIGYTDDSYHTDAISGVSVHVDVFPLADEALVRN